MGILRSDIVTHSSLEPTGGSIVLDGVGDYLTFAASNAFSPATSDVTFELWFYLTDDSDFSSGSGNYYLFDMGSNGYRIQMYEGLIRFGIDGSTWTPPASGVSKSVWHHAAGVRQGNSLDLYLDGNHVGQKSTTASVTSTSLTIGNYGGAPYDGEPYGYISNFRFVKGVVYDKPFTPPKFELKNIAGTIVLGCQSSSSATDFAVTPSAITAQGNAAASSFHPDLKKDITDIGPTFADNTKFDTLSYMVPPGGTTTQRGRGRALIAGGTYGGGWGTKVNTISYIQIQSGGITKDFGDLSSLRTDISSVSSSTRAVFGGGSEGASANNAVNTIEFVTIASSSNVTDFGDLTSLRRPRGGVSNNTRGLFAGGEISPSSKAEVDHVTIATTGNATDFGDLSVSGIPNEGSSNSTRGVWMGGHPWGAQIEYVTIASSGSGADFGDVSDNRINAAGASSSTRALAAGGGTATNTIDYITLATLGDAVDFGDLTQGRRTQHGTSNGIRGIFCGGYTPDYDIIDSVIIATTGNAVNYGDLTTALREPDACSDSHGGLS